MNKSLVRSTLLVSLLTLSSAVMAKSIMLRPTGLYCDYVDIEVEDKKTRPTNPWGQARGLVQVHENVKIYTKGSSLLMGVKEDQIRFRSRLYRDMTKEDLGIQSIKIGDYRIIEECNTLQGRVERTVALRFGIIGNSSNSTRLEQPWTICQDITDIRDN